MDEKDPLTEIVIGAAIEVHRIMGPGLLESIYQRCMEEELKILGCACQPLARVPLLYKGIPLGDDLVMDLYSRPTRGGVEGRRETHSGPRGAVAFLPQTEQDACWPAYQL